MIREIIKPKNSTLTIKIPQEYVGKEIEYIIFPVKSNSAPDSGISAIGGSLHKYADSSKIELEDDAWKLHVVEKFSK